MNGSDGKPLVKRRETNNPRDIHDNVDNYVDKCITLTKFCTRSAMVSTVTNGLKSFSLRFSREKTLATRSQTEFSEE